ncbi:hypothetical protein QBC38DRAFT_548040 [Podospora fimiseda]|uniref:Calcineurin-like phosphoesterase domain-containing protein n=1 Tax=Podospora fimiseda TaxID=252190 RepID=A0AAN7BIP4_9PEZI|nr:hypothetical protein QBC38DRAFT_548040 [Podospora fimiseda]
MATGLLILSDTHNESFHIDGAHNHNIDIVLHCGDMTMISATTRKPSMRTIRQNQKRQRRCFTTPKRRHSVSLKPGVHTFTLKSGLSFSLYASPYTPDFNGYAFPYFPHEDIFNKGETRIHEQVDIVMTHGPPMPPKELSLANYKLDVGRNGEHCGCTKLFEAVQRVRPLIHCFGHIHQGYDVQLIGWKDEDNDAIRVDDVKVEDGGVTESTTRGKETMLVNAAVSRHGQELNKSWLVDLIWGDDGKLSGVSSVQIISIA